jgi:hypothetical protein
MTLTNVDWEGLNVKSRLLAAAIFATLTLGEAHAAYMTGNELLRQCEGDVAQQIWCMAYIGAVSDTVEFVQAIEEFKQIKKNCLPLTAEVGQVKDVVLKWLRDNPTQRQGPAALLATLAIQQAWPCNSN